MLKNSLNKINQKEYLKKYLSGDKTKKKKKKEKKYKKSEHATVKIIDDDISHLDCVNGIDDDLLLGGDDAPQIVAVYTEEQPPNEKSVNKWKSIAVKEESQDDNDGVDLSIRSAAIELNIKKEKKSPTPDTLLKHRKKHKNKKKTNSHDDEQMSSHKHRNECNYNEVRNYTSHNQDNSSKLSNRKQQSSPKKYQSKNDSDQSPPRNYYIDSDQSPPRKHVNRKSNESPPRKNRYPPHSVTPDLSPTRKRRHLMAQNKSSKHSKSERYRSTSSDQSPKRRKHKNLSSDELSSSRRKHKNHLSYKIKRESVTIKQESTHNSSSLKERLTPPPTHKPKPERTLEGKRAGLQSSSTLKEETAERLLKEHRLFEQMPNEISGRDAEVQTRSTARLGRKARLAREETSVERTLRVAKEEEIKLKYERLGKGLKQIDDYRQRKAEEQYESSKPLARYADDEDLDRYLREKEYADDPMLEYMRKKRKEKENLSDKVKKPIYEGSYPENRFGIRPGYRWDGVDRSNGYEVKWLSVQNERQAKQEEAYKYSVEDM